MKRFRFLMVSTVILLSVSGLALSSTYFSADLKKIKEFFSRSHKQSKNHVDLLFLQQSDSGSIAPITDEPGCYRLILSDLRKKVLYFTDQPKRSAGNITNQEFMEVWKHNAIVPNVAMQAFTVDSNNVREINLVTQLKQAKYNEQAHTMTYKACIIEKEKEALQHIPRSELRSINLFIDPLHQWPP